MSYEFPYSDLLDQLIELDNELVEVISRLPSPALKSSLYSRLGDAYSAYSDIIHDLKRELS